MGRRILLIGLIKLDFGRVSQGNVFVDTAHFRLCGRQHLGGICHLLSQLGENLVTIKLIILDVGIILNFYIFVKIGNLVEKATQFEVVVSTEHLHLSNA